MKKFLSIVLTIAMILSTVSVVAFADTAEATDALLAAIDNAANGDTITVIEDVLISALVTDKEITISGTVTLADQAVVKAPNLKASFTSEPGATATVNCTPCQGHFYLFVLRNVCLSTLQLTIPSNG